MVYTLFVVVLEPSESFCTTEFTYEYGDKCYSLATDTKTWADAYTYCSGIGGQMVRMPSLFTN